MTTGVHEHHTLCAILEDTTVVDQLGAPNLLCAERLVRGIQLIEHFWEDQRARQGWAASARPFSMVCPTAMDQISRELEQLGDIRNNAWRLREDFTGRPPPPGGPAVT